MYDLLERHMLEQMGDSAHDCQHVYRVLCTALDIAKAEAEVDQDVLVGACLLHDIGRERQFHDPALCHAAEGGKMAYAFLVEHGWEPDTAAHVEQCVRAHRFRTGVKPESIEAKILYDADKLDATGAMGIARTLLYQGNVNEPIYSVDQDGYVLDGMEEKPPSFFHEYQHKLKTLYGQFYTRRGSELAEERREIAEMFYQALLLEARQGEIGLIAEILGGLSLW